MPESATAEDILHQTVAYMCVVSAVKIISLDLLQKEQAPELGVRFGDIISSRLSLDYYKFSTLRDYACSFTVIF